MTIGQLLHQLGKYPRDAEVFVHDASTDDDLPLEHIALDSKDGTIVLRAADAGDGV